MYAEPFWIDPFVAKEEKRLRRMAIKCFNCGEDHHINHCTEVRMEGRGGGEEGEGEGRGGYIWRLNVSTVE